MVIYSLDTIIYNGNLILDGYSSNINGISLKPGLIYECGYKTDVSDGINYAENTVVLKVNGDLTIKSGVTITAISNEFGGPKGLVIYCTGTLINDGEISMSQRGGYAKGENVYLYKNNNNSYEFVPAIGSTGGEEVLSKSIFGTIMPNGGKNGINRSTAGGSSGGIRRDNKNTTINCSSGKGGNGTSYSGGGAGGFGICLNDNRKASGGDAIGNTGECGETNTILGKIGQFTPSSNNNGTGGLLIIFSGDVLGSGTFSSCGYGSCVDDGWIYIGGTRFMWYPGQGGGGSINIFSKNPEQVYENFSFVTMNEASKNLKGSLGSCEASVTCGIISSIGYTNIFNNY